MEISVQNGVLIGNDTEGTVGNLTLFDESHTVFRYESYQIRKNEKKYQ